MGEGRFSEVYRNQVTSSVVNSLGGVWHGTTPVALKRLKNVSDAELKKFEYEIQVMRDLKHPNIVQYDCK